MSRSATSAALQASSVFCQQILQRGHVEHRFGEKLLQPPVLVLERFQSARLGHLQPAVARLPFVERGRADAMPPTDLPGPRSGLLLAKIAMICSSLNRLLRIVRLLA